jgi:hypothetical protein
VTAALGYVAMFQGSVNAVRREYDRMSASGAKIAQAGALASDMDQVSLSKEALAAGRGNEDPLAEGIEKPLVDMRVSKYVAIANLRVMSTADEMARETTNLVRPRSSR